MSKLKFVAAAIAIYLLLMFKSCETIQYKAISEAADAEVTGVVSHRSRRGTSWQAEYVVEMPNKSFGGKLGISQSEIRDYPKGRKLEVLVLHSDRPFPNSIVKGSETSLWLYPFVIITLLGGAWIVRSFLSAYKE